MPNTQDISEVLTEDAWRLRSQPYEDGTPYFVFETGKGFFDRTDAPRGFRFAAIMSESDARLIVAAPDLCDALDMLLDRATRSEIASFSECETARAALRKARPEQSAA